MVVSSRYEQRLWRQGYLRIAGVDEVGRGAWAGPIVAAAVSLTAADLTKLGHEPWFSKVCDSKILSAQAREKISAGFCSASRGWSVVKISPKAIDDIGIGSANRLAVCDAVACLRPKPDYVIADYVAKLGNAVAGISTETLIHGDAKVFCVALASIVAKVYRDGLMRRLDKRYPGYGFAQHKGYGTLQHQAALKRLGPCPAHRHSYRPVANALLY